MCMADYADNDGGVCLGTDVRKARKAHRCDECWRAIVIGESHHVSIWACDGGITTFRMCVHCHIAAEWLQQNCGGYLWGGIWDDIDEHVEEYRGVYPAVARELKRLSVRGHGGWRFQRGPRKGAMLPVPTMPRFPTEARA